MRAREPDQTDMVERDGVSVGYEVFGEGDPTIVLLTSWAIVHARQWKAQVPYLARHFRVITIEGRGNGRADRPADADGLSRPRVRRRRDRRAGRRRGGPGVSSGCRWAGGTRCSSRPGTPTVRPAWSRSAPALPWPSSPGTSPSRGRATRAGRRRTSTTGAPTTAAGSSSSCPRSSPSRTRPSSARTASGGGWRPTPRRCCSPAAGIDDATPRTPRRPAGRCAARCWSCTATRTRSCRTRPALALAGWTGGELVTFHGGGHAPTAARPGAGEPADPRVRRVADAAGRAAGAPGPGPATGASGRCSSSSPIGLGHVRRDLAIADELRQRHPDLEIDWLTQDPVTRRAGGARRAGAPGVAAGWPARAGTSSPRPASTTCTPSRRCAGWTRSWSRTSTSSTTWWPTSPTTCGSSTRAGTSTTSCSTTPSSSARAYAWLTDFVGMLPMADGGAAEAALTADFNAERVERMRRYPRLRDRSIFVGNPGDLVDDPLGPGLPTVRDWALGALRVLRVRHRVRPARRPRGAARRAGLSARRAGLHGRRSAGPGSARTCCAGSPRRSRRPRSAYPACGWSR